MESNLTSNETNENSFSISNKYQDSSCRSMKDVDSELIIHMSESNNGNKIKQNQNLQKFDNMCLFTEDDKGGKCEMSFILIL